MSTKTKEELEVSLARLQREYIHLAGVSGKCPPIMSEDDCDSPKGDWGCKKCWEEYLKIIADGP